MGGCFLPEVTVFYGLYGSGKSEIAINYALDVARSEPVMLVDLDAVTPYFRVRDVRDQLESLGVKVIAPKESLKSADLPVLPVGVRRVIQHGPAHIVIDVGGDPTGSRVLGGLRDALPDDARGLFVVNSRRPFTRTVPEAKLALEAISESAGLPAAGLVSNTHLAELTDVSHVLEGIRFGLELSKESGLPLVFAAAPETLKEKEQEIRKELGGRGLLWLRRFLLKPWEIDR